MVAAGVAFTVVMVVVIALDIGIKFQGAGKHRLHRGIRIAGHAAEQPDTGLCQCHLRAAANTAADQNVHIQSVQNPCQCAVTAAAGVYHRGGNDLVVRHLVDLELLGVTKVLEDLTVLIGNCNFHNESPFGFRICHGNSVIVRLYMIVYHLFLQMANRFPSPRGASLSGRSDV